MAGWGAGVLVARRDNYTDLVKQAPSGVQPRVLQLLGDIVFKDEQSRLDVVAAASVSTVKGVVAVKNAAGEVIGYLPVYTTYA